MARDGKRRGFGWPALAALLAGLLLPAAASAIPVQADPEATDHTDCLDRPSPPSENLRIADPVNGNFWARRDTFTVDPACVDGFFEADIFGISVIVKTPFQIDSTPDVDDIDDATDFNILAAEMESLWPEFDQWAASAQGNPMGSDPPPTVGEEGAFTSVRICVNVGSVAACLAAPPDTMTDIGGGFMIHTIDLGPLEEEIYLCTGDCSEEVVSFELVTLAHSNVFDAPMGDVHVPELVIGFRFVELVNVPEPGLALLLLPALARLASRRRRQL